MTRSEKKKENKQNKCRTWKKSILYVILIVLVLLLISIFVFKEHILEKIIKDAVYDKSNGKYELSFSDIDYSLKDNSILLLDFYLKGDTTIIVDDEKRNIYEIIIDSLELRDLRMFKLYPSRKLLIRNFLISSPLVKIFTGDTNTTKNPHIELKNALHQSAMKFFKEISIDTFTISNGVLDIYKFPYDTSINSSIQSFDVQLANFELDESSDTSIQNLFFSEHIDLSLKGFRKNLKNHFLSARKMRLSTSEEVFEISGFEVNPDLDKNPDEKLKVITPYTKIKGFDIEKLAFGEELDIDSIIIHETLVHYRHKGEPSGLKTNNYSNSQIYSILSPLVKKLSIHCLRFMDGKLEIVQKVIQPNQVLHIEDLSLLLERIVLDSNIALLDFENMVKGELLITGKSSSFSKTNGISVSMGNTKYSAEKEQLKLKDVRFSDPGQSKDTLIVHLADLELTETSIWKFLKGDYSNFGHLKIQNINVNKQIVKNAPTVSGGGLGHNMRFASLKIDDGILRLNFIDSTGKYAHFMSRINVYTENLLLDTNRSSGFSQPDCLDLKLHDLVLDHPQKLSLNTEKLAFNSDSKTLLVRGLKASNPAINHNVRKFNLSEFQLLSFELENFNYWNLLNNQHLNVAFSNLKQPDFKFLINPEIEDHQRLHQAHHKIESQLQDYLKIIQMDTFRVSGLSATFKKLNNADDVFRLEDVNARFLGVKLDTVIETRDSKLFYAEDFDLNINNINIPDNHAQYDFSIDRISVSKSKNMIDVLGIEYAPAQSDSTEDDQQTRIKIPHLIAQGVNFDNYYFNHDINIDEIKLPSPTFLISSSQDSSTTRKSLPLIRVPDFADSFRIGKVSLEEADMQLIDEGRFFLSSDLSAYFYDLSFDSSLIYQPLHSELPLERFNILLNDVSSILEKNNALIRFDSLYASSQEQELQVYNLKYYDTLSAAGRRMIFSNRHLSFEGLLFDSLFRGNGLLIRHLIIDSSCMQMDIHAEDGTGSPGAGISLPPPFHFVNVDETDLVNVDLSLLNTSNEKYFSLDNIHGKIYNFQLDSGLMDKPGFMLSKSIDLAKSEYTIYSSDSMYTFTLEDIAISTGENRLDIGDFKIQPNYPKFEFSRELGYQTDRMDVDFQGIKIRGLDFEKILMDQTLNAKKVEVNSTQFESFRDKRVPFPEWHTSPMPQDLLESIGFGLMVDTLTLEKASITYGEMVEKSVHPGKIHFNDMHVRLTNITNDSMRILKNPVMGLDANGQIMNKGLLNVKLNLKLNHPSDTFAFHANLSRMDLSEFNSLSVNLFGVEIKSGNGSVDTVNIFGNKDYAIGHLYFPYRKFKIKMINRQKGNRGGIGDGILTFLANNILLKSNNRRFGRPIRVGQIFYQRDPQKSIFNYLWKGVLSGVESTLGYNNREQRKEMKAYKQGLGNEIQEGNN